MIDRADPKREEICKEVIAKIEKNNIKFVWLNFVDISGMPKQLGVRASRIEDMLSSGESFDGSSITGYGVLEESDKVVIPDPSTFAIIPWRTSEAAVGRFICDIYNPNDTRYTGDPRYILKQATDKAAAMGYKYNVAPELEFFWLKPGSSGPTEIDLRGYFDADPADENQLMRREVAMYADAFPDLEVDTVHHEVAKSQHEVDIKYGNANEIADASITLKMLVKVVGARHGNIGTFIAKPFVGHNGSGMHIHQSLWKDGKNSFFDAKDPNQISQTMRYFIAGQLKHAKEFTAILNSWPNSYKRLVPGYEAPTYIAWGFKNRSMMIRVPNFQNKDKAARCEIRSPDGMGNNYLQFAVLLSAGLDGIKNKIEPPAPVELNVFHVAEEERSRMGIENIPGSLGDALDKFEESALMKEVLGEKAFHAFLDSKRKEFQLYSAQVSDWELKRYTSVL